MYKVIFKYPNGGAGVCTENGEPILFDTYEAAAKFADEKNDIPDDIRSAFPVWEVVDATTDALHANYIILYTTYAPDTDITFIMRDEYSHSENLISTECLGWYHGEADDELTQNYIGKLKAEY